MKIGIHLIMPVMRESYISVLCDLENQTRLIDKLSIYDNSGQGIVNINPNEYFFEIEIIDNKGNIGTNAVWNKMFDSEYEYVGVVGDDYLIDRNAIKKLRDSFNLIDDAGAVTATIFKERDYVEQPDEIRFGKVVGKGHIGLTLFKKCILDCIPSIPKELFVFYGDNWLHYWLKQIGKYIYEINVGISHYHKKDLKAKVGYNALARKEASIWRNWSLNKIEL